jgi:hypothetical protein
LEQRHYKRIQERALDAANASRPPRRDWKKPAAIAGGSLAAVVLAWVFISRAFPDNKPEDEAALTEVAGQGAESAAGVELRDTEITGFMSSVINAKSIEELLELVDHPEESEPRMREFYQQGGMYELPMGGFIVKVDQLEHNDKSFKGVFVDRLFGSTTMVPIRQTEDGKPTLRWEELVGWTDPDWTEVIESKPEAATLVKVFVVIDDYFNYDYRDESKWICFKLFDRSLEHSCYAYLERSSPEAYKLEGFRSYTPISVEIKFTPGQERDQAEIVKFHHVGWMED